MDVPWHTFAFSTFCQNYSHVNSENLGSKEDVDQLRDELSKIEIITFRALVRPVKVIRSLEKSFKGCFSNAKPNITHAFRLPVMLWGESENLLVIRITWQGIECVELDELVAFSTFVKGTIIWDNTEIHAKLHELARCAC